MGYGEFVSGEVSHQGLLARQRQYVSLTLVFFGRHTIDYHPLFLRHDPLLCQKIKRKTQPSLTDLQAANRLRNDVALPTLELAPTHPFVDNTALRTTEGNSLFLLLFVMVYR